MSKISPGETSSSQNSKTPVHVDDFVDDIRQDRYARWCLMLFRLPAILQADFAEFTRSYRLFCTYGGQRYRVTGASRMGDVWLHPDFTQDTGYKLRVDVTVCSAWSNKPDESPVT